MKNKKQRKREPSPQAAVATNGIPNSAKYAQLFRKLLVHMIARLYRGSTIGLMFEDNEIALPKQWDRFTIINLPWSYYQEVAEIAKQSDYIDPCTGLIWNAKIDTPESWLSCLATHYDRTHRIMMTAHFEITGQMAYCPKCSNYPYDRQRHSLDFTRKHPRLSCDNCHRTIPFQPVLTERAKRHFELEMVTKTSCT